ncbi:unnamed protein product [Phytophthora fragariaefolia]|uniref:Unnamed protein product n=1 Tax=Phytophthora fragariaefolia TaxID=1490495 RepID=A0A9W7D6C9_9STRA|nr:unnamed protein product [Phytophthora fragariaefolia]
MSSGNNAFWSFDPTNATTSPVVPPVVSASEATPAPSTLSVSDYFAEHRWPHGPSPMENAGDGAQAPLPRRGPSPFEPNHKWNDGSTGSVCTPRLLGTPNPFPERPAGLLGVRELSEFQVQPQRVVDVSMEEFIVSNSLDEAQSPQIERELQAPASKRPVAQPLLMASVHEYGFNYAIRRRLFAKLLRSC